ncbi:MAG: hypothetical protein ACJAXA_001236, partial [Candidatus Aldehydirespiratoraceae bacterium]
AATATTASAKWPSPDLASITPHSTEQLEQSTAQEKTT